MGAPARGKHTTRARRLTVAIADWLWEGRVPERPCFSASLRVSPGSMRGGLDEASRDMREAVSGLDFLSAGGNKAGGWLPEAPPCAERERFIIP